MISVTFWGTRGSLATPDPEMMRMGGNTSCVGIHDSLGSVLVLDAGTGIRRLGRTLAATEGRVDVLLTHLHMDHIQGLGFFAPFFQPGREVHLWGPPSATEHVLDRLARYLSPPLFPVHLRDVSSHLEVHDLTGEDIRIGPFDIQARFVCHPNPTVGLRVTDGDSTITYLPDHEPALGSGTFDRPPEWISGYSLAAGTDLLIHDAQYSADEYPSHAGWGHSSMRQAFDFAALAGARMLVPFHHDPSHTDADIDRIVAETIQATQPAFTVMPAMEGVDITLESGTPQSKGP